jgi:hypothetical protein
MIIGLLDFEASTYSKLSAHRWRCGCQPYASAARQPFTSMKIPGFHICLRLSRPQRHSQPGRITSIANSNDLRGNGTRNFPSCRTVAQQSTLSCAPKPLDLEGLNQSYWRIHDSNSTSCPFYLKNSFNKHFNWVRLSIKSVSVEL